MRRPVHEALGGVWRGPRAARLYQPRNVRPNARASSTPPKRSGKSGRYFIVLKCDSE